MKNCSIGIMEGGLRRAWSTATNCPKLGCHVRDVTDLTVEKASNESH